MRRASEKRFTYDACLCSRFRPTYLKTPSDSFDKSVLPANTQSSGDHGLRALRCSLDISIKIKYCGLSHQARVVRPHTNLDRISREGTKVHNQPSLQVANISKAAELSHHESYLPIHKMYVTKQEKGKKNVRVTTYQLQQERCVQYTDFRARNRWDRKMALAHCRKILSGLAKEATPNIYTRLRFDPGQRRGAPSPTSSRTPRFLPYTVHKCDRNGTQLRRSTGPP